MEERAAKVRPVPLIGIQGAQRFHDELMPCMEATSNRRFMALRFISLAEGHKYPPMKGSEAHAATDASGPVGMLKTRWMDKWCFRLPSVVLCVVDLADVFRRNRPSTTRENKVALQVESLRRSFAGRDVKMALLLIHDEPGAFVTDDFVEGVRKRVHIEKRYIKVLYASDLSPTSSALIQLEKSVQTLAEAFYKQMCKRLRKRLATLSASARMGLQGVGQVGEERSAVTLAWEARKHFQLGYAYEFRGETEKALINYRQCFAAVTRMAAVVGRAIAAAAKAKTRGAGGQPYLRARLCECRELSSLVTLRLCRIYLSSSPGRVKNAVAQFEKHMLTFRTIVPTGSSPQLHRVAHAAAALPGGDVKLATPGVGAGATVAEPRSVMIAFAAYCAWLSREYRAFGQFLKDFEEQQQAATGGAASKSAASDLMHPAFYFHQAAMWAIERRVCAQRLGVFHSASGSAVNAEMVQSSAADGGAASTFEIVVERRAARFIGQLPMLIVSGSVEGSGGSGGGGEAGSAAAAAAAAAGSTVRTYCAARGGTGDRGLPVALAEEEGTGTAERPPGVEVVSALQLLLEDERAFDHSRDVLRLLALARGARALQASNGGASSGQASRQRPRLEMYALSLEVAECLFARKFRAALPLVQDVAQGYRVERWWGLLRVALEHLWTCSLMTGNVEVLATSSLDLLSPLMQGGAAKALSASGGGGGDEEETPLADGAELMEVFHARVATPKGHIDRLSSLLTFSDTTLALPNAARLARYFSTFVAAITAPSEGLAPVRIAVDHVQSPLFRPSINFSQRSAVGGDEVELAVEVECLIECDEGGESEAASSGDECGFALPSGGGAIPIERVEVCMNRTSYSFTLDVDLELKRGAPLCVKHNFTVFPTLGKTMQALSAALAAEGAAPVAAENDDSPAVAHLRKLSEFASADLDAVSVTQALHDLGTASIGLEAGTRDGGLGSSSAAAAADANSPQCELIFPTELILHVRDSCVSLSFPLPGGFTARHASTVPTTRATPQVPVLRVEPEVARATLAVSSMHALPILQGGDVTPPCGGGATKEESDGGGDPSLPPSPAQLEAMSRHPIAVEIETGPSRLETACLHVELLSNSGGSRSDDAVAYIRLIGIRAVGASADDDFEGSTDDIVVLRMAEGTSAGTIELPASLPPNSRFRVAFSVQFSHCRAYRLSLSACYRTPQMAILTSKIQAWLSENVERSENVEATPSLLLPQLRTAAVTTDLVVRAPFDVSFTVTSDAPHAFSSIPLLSPTVIAAELALVSASVSKHAIDLVSVELNMRSGAHVAVISAVGAQVKDNEGATTAAKEVEEDGGDPRNRTLHPSERHSCLFRIQPGAMSAATEPMGDLVIRFRKETGASQALGGGSIALDDCIIEQRVALPVTVVEKAPVTIEVSAPEKAVIGQPITLKLALTNHTDFVQTLQVRRLCPRA